MKIASVNLNNQRTSFGSAFPVVHWVAETNGSYAPIGNLKTVRLLQGKVVRVLNKPLSVTVKPMNLQEQKLRAYISSSDSDYRNQAIVRSFYRHTNNGNPEKFTPVSYIITGKDVATFNNKFGRDIGEAKGKARANSGSSNSLETATALRQYKYGGLSFVNDENRQYKDEKGVKYILHTKFEVVRNKLGKIKDYRFVDAKFLPASGPKNPLDRLC